MECVRRIFKVLRPIRLMLLRRLDVSVYLTLRSQRLSVRRVFPHPSGCPNFYSSTRNHVMRPQTIISYIPLAGPMYYMKSPTHYYDFTRRSTKIHRHNGERYFPFFKLMQIALSLSQTSFRLLDSRHETSTTIGRH